MTDGGGDSKVFADSQVFEEVVCSLLEQGLSVRFQARGASMSPAIRDGEIVEVTPVIVPKLRKDDIVLAKSHCGFRLHRIVLTDPAKDLFITRGDCGQENDPALKSDQILGLARAKEVRVGRNIVQARFRGVGGWLLRSIARGQVLASRVKSRAFGTSLQRTSSLAILSVLIAVATLSRAQVAVDASTSAQSAWNSAGGHNLSFNHTTAAGANLLLVGVSLNITNNTGAGVASVTYNGTPLSFVGAHNDAGNTRRVEMYYMLAPVAGNNTVVVRVNLPVAGAVGAAAGATTF